MLSLKTFFRFFLRKINVVNWSTFVSKTNGLSQNSRVYSMGNHGNRLFHQWLSRKDSNRVPSTFWNPILSIDSNDDVWANLYKTDPAKVNLLRLCYRIRKSFYGWFFLPFTLTFVVYGVDMSRQWILMERSFQLIWWMKGFRRSKLTATERKLLLDNLISQVIQKCHSKKYHRCLSLKAFNKLILGKKSNKFQKTIPHFDGVGALVF